MAYSGPRIQVISLKSATNLREIMSLENYDELIIFPEVVKTDDIHRPLHTIGIPVCFAAEGPYFQKLSDQGVREVIDEALQEIRDYIDQNKPSIIVYETLEENFFTRDDPCEDGGPWNLDLPLFERMAHVRFGPIGVEVRNYISEVLYSMRSNT